VIDPEKVKFEGVKIRLAAKKEIVTPLNTGAGIRTDI
jgi:hypothetical protein